ncbi:hypothetical protein N177_3392 [Lutibaculum baratangense AMV1]|uniref:Uncharacterized protein n=1 Tax=Lutibaculum baratangense AMV1 TaxID=631454 RepID=V4RD56_9HYPH|nr:hypothetical protein N177_3392 [Lutibaculum baratangense AMV1]
MWATAYQAHLGEIAPPLTAKEQGQLKNFHEKCPEGEAAAVLNRVVREWHEFCGWAKHDAGIHKSPDKPHIGFVLKFIGPAVDFHRDALKTAPKPKATAPKKPLQVLQVPAQDWTQDVQNAFEEWAEDKIPAPMDDVCELMGWDPSSISDEMRKKREEERRQARKKLMVEFWHDYQKELAN